MSSRVFIPYQIWTRQRCDTCWYLESVTKPKQNQDVNLDLRVDFVRFKPQKISSIRKNIKKDPVLIQLTKMIVNGWPDSILDVPTDIRIYWSYWDKLSSDDGLILKSECIFIPQHLTIYSNNYIQATLSSRKHVYGQNELCIGQGS